MLKALIVPIALLAAACSPPAAQNAAESDADMNMTESTAPAPAGPINGVGTVTAVDAAAGRVSLDHDPIAAISWPAMSMQFTVEAPADLQGIAVGDRVSFELKSATETQVITSITEQ
jgi:Cu(I)/Ag(I) efflux system protein CusF